jgi:hypothetical protein
LYLCSYNLVSSVTDTTTNGAPHVHHNLAKGPLQREDGEKLAHAAMVTATRAHCGSPPF